MTVVDRLVVRAVYAQQLPGIGPVVKFTLYWMGIEIKARTIGPGLRLLHPTNGYVIHNDTVIGRNVTIFHGVTIGRADAWLPYDKFAGFVVEDEVILSAGSSIINSSNSPPLVVGRGTILAANSLLTRSTGPDEIWMGVPARRVGQREGAGTPPLRPFLNAE